MHTGSLVVELSHPTEEKPRTGVLGSERVRNSAMVINQSDRCTALLHADQSRRPAKEGGR